MKTTNHGLGVLLVVLLVGASPAVRPATGGTPRFTEERSRAEDLCRSVQPAVADLTGFEVGEPIRVTVLDRSHLRDYLLDTLEREYPSGELDRRQRCFAEIGLVERDVDLQAAMVALVGDQAGGLFDPFDKVYVAISDLPADFQGEATQRLIVGHELIHALQDRRLDLAQRYKQLLSDLDVGFAFTAVVEGTAMVGGLAHSQGVPPLSLGDVAAMLRSGYDSMTATMPALASAPVYVRETLVSPYVDGSGFVMWYLQHHPGTTMADIFDDLPVSAEQVIHPEKFGEAELPADLDLEGAFGLVPGQWLVVYDNTLGELEFRTLFLNQGWNRREASELARGWDGCRILAFETEVGGTVVLGVSEWDSIDDATEFEDAMSSVLGTLHGPSGYKLERAQRRVGFVTGLGDIDVRSKLLGFAFGETPR